MAAFIVVTDRLDEDHIPRILNVESIVIINGKDDQPAAIQLGEGYIVQAQETVAEVRRMIGNVRPLADPLPTWPGWHMESKGQ